MVRDDRIRTLVDANAADLLGYLSRRVTPREDAADLLGETLLTAWRRRRDLPDEPENARMWLYGVARRVLANHRRGVRRRRALADRLGVEVAGFVATHPDPAEGQEVRDAVAALPEELRELVMLVHWDGFGVGEAADLLELNASTARTRYQRARQLLAEALAPVVS
ncbi:RNA polymerase sigma factor [Protaetiibacter intestinalis]|uniref:Sigma-70 family RNA polymerase sigma factor n=1 Tax=Protaetiibacter intestinalis TaxID=2419774 RepID=A0A387BBC1_9MICO|nr:sigma-70 family RNA polymerase sigma factor [Protaetiibacter intestinalis]AYF98405.1 sigma-70 family RNA polymerase sigma factor [Protaetiibacter intestinalis]